jgi:hypothetical protein
MENGWLNRWVNMTHMTHGFVLRMWDIVALIRCGKVNDMFI